MQRDSTDEENVNRPIQSSKFSTSKNFLASDSTSHTWLIQKYVANYGVEITRKLLFQGLMKEIEQHEESTLLNDILVDNEKIYNTG